MVDLVRMQGVINCAVADSHGFIHPPLTFQVEVWFQVDQPSSSPNYSISVMVDQGANVMQALRLAKQDLELKNLGKVCVKFNGEIVQRSHSISQYTTSEGNPLLLELPEPEGKLHAVTYLMLQVLGEPCNLHSGCYGVEPGSTIKHYNVQVAPTLLVAGPTLTLWIPEQTLFASTSSYSALFKGCLYK